MGFLDKLEGISQTIATSEIIYVFSRIKDLSPIKHTAGQNKVLPCVWRIKKQNVANKVQSPLQLRTPT